MTADRAALDAALIDAHGADDLARLVRLYTEAADQAERGGAVDECCFFLTQAYVFALDVGAAQAAGLHRRLVGYGREE